MKTKLIGIVILLIVLKILLVLFIPVPLGFSDSLTHIEGAKTFFANPSFSSAINTQKYTIFPMLISPLLFLKNMNLVYFFILMLNAIISSLIIFPAYKLAKEFLKDNYVCIIQSLYREKKKMGHSRRNFYWDSYTYKNPRNHSSFHCIFSAALHLNEETMDNYKI